MRVVITGAAGQIGRQLIEELSDSHDLCLIDRFPVSDHRTILADLAQVRPWNRWRPFAGFLPPRWTASFENADVVLHLANEIHHTDQRKRLLFKNIQATWNVLEAAVRYQVPRVVYASSNWVVKALELELAPACYEPDGPKISSEVPPRPFTPYGISKAFGETAGRTMVDEGKLASFVAVRIGSPDRAPVEKGDARFRWLGVHDLRSLFRCCVEAEFKGFHMVYGVSAQPESPYDLSHTCSLLPWSPQQLG